MKSPTEHAIERTCPGLCWCCPCCTPCCSGIVHIALRLCCCCTAAACQPLLFCLIVLALVGLTVYWLTLLASNYSTQAMLRGYELING